MRCLQSGVMTVTQYPVRSMGAAALALAPSCCATALGDHRGKHATDI